MSKCIGYGEFEGKCNNDAGTEWSPHWCQRCNQLRLKTIDKNLREIQKYFENQQIESEDK